MTYVPHFKVSMIGRLGGVTGPEMFSCSFSLAEGENLGLVPWQPNDAVWQDVANDCAAWFSRPTSWIHGDAVLQLVKVAPIGANGKYTAAPREVVVNAAGGAVGAGRPHNQDAYVVTLGTDADLGRVKGRFYAPLPCWGVSSDGRITESQAEDAEASALTLINAINNQPGIDVLDLRVMVASQGRHDRFGVQTLPPGNHEVKRVAVGRVVDTQRRRRNKLLEAKTFRAVATPN